MIEHKFREILENKIQNMIQVKLRSRGMWIREFRIAWHVNGLQELCFETRSKIAGKDTTYVINGKVDDMGNIYDTPSMGELV